MNNHIDITFDLETCAVTANAAVMQVAAVAWNRDAESNPFVSDGFPVGGFTFNEHIDLRTCVVDGFDFDPQTVAWWSRQSNAAKQAVCDDLAEPIRDVFANFVEWLGGVKKDAQADTLFLWCQGMDFDGAILRNICHKYDLQLPCKCQQFRDCRTVILEAALVRAEKAGVEHSATLPTPEAILADDRKAYDLYPPLPDEYAAGREAHDALYDAMRSSWNTWQAIKWMK